MEEQTIMDTDILIVDRIDATPIGDGYVNHAYRGRWVQMKGQPKSLTYFAPNNTGDTPAMMMRDTILAQRSSINKLSLALKEKMDKVNPIAKVSKQGIFNEIPKPLTVSDLKNGSMVDEESLSIGAFKEIVLFTKEQLCLQQEQ